MRDVFTTLDAAQAMIVRLALTDARIEYYQDNEILGHMDGGAPITANPYIFRVRPEDFDAAAAVIREALDRIREMPRPEAGHKKKP